MTANKIADHTFGLGKGRNILRVVQIYRQSRGDLKLRAPTGLPT